MIEMIEMDASDVLVSSSYCPTRAPASDLVHNNTTIASKTGTVDMNAAFVRDLKAKIDGLHRQLEQSRIDNAAKDRTIAALQQQLRQKDNDGQQLDAKLGQFYINRLFNNQNALSVVQDEIDGDLRNIMEQKLLLRQQGEGAEDDTIRDDDESSSFMSDFESSAPSELSSNTSSLSVLQRQRLDLLRHQKKLDDCPVVYPTNPSSVHDIVDQIQRWLFLEGGNLRDVQSLLTEYCNFCRTNCDLPHLDRLYVAGMMLPPEVSAYVWKWENGKEFQQREVPHSAFEKPNFNPDEPFSFLMEGRAMEYRMNASSKIPSGCEWFTEGKYQDYLALPIYHRGEYVGAMAWATKSPSGFSSRDIQIFYESLAALSTVLRLHTNDIVMTTLQERLAEHLKAQTRDLAEANNRLAAANDRVL